MAGSLGQPITAIYDVKKLGIWQTSEAAQATIYGVQPGDIKLEDVNKNNAVGADDRQIIGDFQPDFVAGLSNRFEYKNFDLNIVYVWPVWTNCSSKLLFC